MRRTRMAARRVLMLLAGAFVLGGCGGTDAPDGGASLRDTSSSSPREPETAKTSVHDDSAATSDPREIRVFRCTDPSGTPFRVEVRPTDGGIELWLPGRFGSRTYGLERVRAASGETYEGSGIVFRDRGDEADLVVDGEEYRGCTQDLGGWVWAAARRRGVDFRASGDEPGWYMELTRGDSLHLVYDYGEGELTVATPEPTGATAGGPVRYRAETAERDLTIVIEDEPCVAMSGTEFPKAVTVRLDGTSYRGCGRWLDGGSHQTISDSREQGDG